MGETGALLKWREERRSRTAENNNRRGTSCMGCMYVFPVWKSSWQREDRNVMFAWTQLEHMLKAWCCIFKSSLYQVVHLNEADLKRWSGLVSGEEWQAHLTDRYHRWCLVPLQVAALIRTSIMWLEFNGLSPQKAVRWSLLILSLKWVCTLKTCVNCRSLSDHSETEIVFSVLCWMKRMS